MHHNVYLYTRFLCIKSTFYHYWKYGLQENMQLIISDKYVDNTIDVVHDHPNLTFDEPKLNHL